MTPATDIHLILNNFWGYQSFRPFQEEIINSVVKGGDTFAVLPTGGGKSLCFQVPALALPGTCLVISPLIALMRDQIDQLRKRNVPAAGLYSGQHADEALLVMENFVNEAYKLLYISPERLHSERFKAYLRNAKLSFLAVDEAHCISQWGYDFRPLYLKIKSVRDIFPDLPIMALTASATPTVQKDIQDKLGLKSNHIFKGSFLRPNLSFSGFELENKGAKLIDILRAVPGCAVLYVQSRKNASTWATWLIHNGFVADYYHAGLSPKDRERKQKNWINNKTRILVATNAFGMGIDKGDVRLVVHLDAPTQPEAYYQEAGRAGRDTKKAYAVALFGRQELAEARRKIEQHYPTATQLRNIYEKTGIYLKLAYGSGEMTSFDFELEQFCKTFSLHPSTTYQTLKKLETAGYLLLSEAFLQPSRLHFTVSQSVMYDAQVRNPKTEEIIKALLRLYGGELYSDFLEIKESEVATILKTSLEAVKETLNALTLQNLVLYQPQQNTPQITFLTPRLESKNLQLDTSLLEQLKQNELDRLNTIEQYLMLQNGCRSAFLAAYFGEANPPECGICDLCAARKKKNQPQGLTHYKSLIVNKLTSPISSKDLEDSFKPAEREEVRKVIGFLLAEEILTLNTKQQLMLVNTDHPN